MTDSPDTPLSEARITLLNKIKADCIKDGFEDRVQRVVIAVAEYQNGFASDQTCAACGSLIEIEGLGDPVCAWSSDCECHDCRSTFRGL